jgi:hypothetical protein
MRPRRLASVQRGAGGRWRLRHVSPRQRSVKAISTGLALHGAILMPASCHPLLSQRRDTGREAAFDLVRKTGPSKCALDSVQTGRPRTDVDGHLRTLRNRPKSGPICVPLLRQFSALSLVRQMGSAMTGVSRSPSVVPQLHPTERVASWSLPTVCDGRMRIAGGTCANQNDCGQ